MPLDRSIDHELDMYISGRNQHARERAGARAGISLRRNIAPILRIVLARAGPWLKDRPRAPRRPHRPRAETPSSRHPPWKSFS